MSTLRDSLCNEILDLELCCYDTHDAVGILCRNCILCNDNTLSRYVCVSKIISIDDYELIRKHEEIIANENIQD